MGSILNCAALRAFIRGCLSKLDAVNRVRAGRVDIFPINDSVSFMGCAPLVLWAIAIGFGLRLIDAMGRLLGGSRGAHMKLWSLIFTSSVCK